MKPALLALALLAASPAAAAVTYSFESYAPGTTDVVTSFSYTADSFLTGTHTQVAASDLDSCSSTAGPCGSQYFDRAPNSGLFGPGHDILISEAGNLGVFHFFDYGAFAASGTYLAGNPDIGVTGKLIVSESVGPVPEPGEWAMMGAGVGVVGFIARRRKRG